MAAMSVNRRSIFRSSFFLRFRLFSSNSGNNNNKLFDGRDDFESRLFSDIGRNAENGSFYRKLDKIEKAHGRSYNGMRDEDGGISRFMDGQSEGFDTLSDGMDSKLKQSATTFAMTDEVNDDEYKFRPDITFWPGTTYTPKDLDLTKPGIPRSSKRLGFETTTKDALKKADFRNVRFLSNFLTEAGIIIKRSQTKISATAQRKVAREIKTARALGLMPFTTMGTKHFIFGKSMKDDDEEFEYENYGGASSPTLGNVER